MSRVVRKALTCNTTLLPALVHKEHQKLRILQLMTRPVAETKNRYTHTLSKYYSVSYEIFTAFFRGVRISKKSQRLDLKQRVLRSGVDSTWFAWSRVKQFNVS